NSLHAHCDSTNEQTAACAGHRPQFQQYPPALGALGTIARGSNGCQPVRNNHFPDSGIENLMSMNFAMRLLIAKLLSGATYDMGIQKAIRDFADRLSDSHFRRCVTFDSAAG